MTDRYDTMSFMVADYLVALNRERALGNIGPHC